MDVPCILGRSCREVVPLLPVLLLLFTVPATSRPHISSTHQTDSHATSSRAPVVRASAVSTGPDSLPTRIQQAQYRCSNSQGTCVSKAAQLGSPVVPTVSPEEWQDRCSCSDLQWLRDYIRCSADQRRALASDPTAAARLKFLVWRAVPDADTEPGQRVAGGLSDRLRGIMWLLRMAATMNRVLLVHQTHPAPLEVFLVPAFIDWSLGSLSLPEPARIFYEWSYLTGRNCSVHTPAEGPAEYKQCMLGMLQDGTLYNTTEQYLFVSTQYHASEALPGGPSVPNTGRCNHHHCMFTALFQASEGSEAAARRQFLAMGVSTQAGGEPYLPRNFSHMPDEGELAGVLECAQGLFHTNISSSTGATRGSGAARGSGAGTSNTGSNNSGSKKRSTSTSRQLLSLSHHHHRRHHHRHQLRAHPERQLRRHTPPQVVVVTDNPQLRRAVLELNRSEVVTTRTAQVHFDHPEDMHPPGASTGSGSSLSEADIRQLQDVVADLAVLAKAECQVYSAGGFSRTARWWGGTQCSLSVQECTAGQAAHHQRRH